MTVSDYPDFATPQAHADAISVTGAPLLILPTVLVNATGNIAGGGSISFGPFTFNQPGYQISVSLTEQVAGVNPDCEVVLTWSDLASGQVVDQQSWWIEAGAPGGAHQVTGRGLTRGNRVRVDIFSSDTTAITASVFLQVTSHLPNRDDWRTFNLVGVTGFTPATSDLLANVVGSRFIAGLGAGASDTTLLPVVAGRVRVHADSLSNANDLELAVRAVADNSLTATNLIYDKFSDATGNLNDYCTLPRAQCTVILTNHNAAAKQVRYALTLEDY